MIHKITKNKTDVTLFITRLIIGGIFIYSGWYKVADMTTTISMFSALGIPTFLLYIVSYGELIGGILLVLGLWTDRASAFLAIIMIFAIYYTRSLGFPVFGMPLAVLAGLLPILGCGAGKYRVGKKF